jgi:hypothetical protein
MEAQWNALLKVRKGLTVWRDLQHLHVQTAEGFLRPSPLDGIGFVTF